MTGVTVSVEGLDATKRRFEASQAAIDFALARAAVEVETLVEGDVGKHAKTGQLERSIFKARITGGWEVGHNTQVAPYARFVHDGARPHVITPDTKRALRWPVAGGFAFAKSVNHPGYSGDAWLRRAAAQALPLFERALNARLQGV